MDGRDDQLLLIGVRGGSEDAARALFRRYWRDVWKAAYAITRRTALADDIAQETFLRALTAIDRIDTGRPVGPWLRRVAANRALDELRLERHTVPYALGEEQEAPMCPYSPEDRQAIARAVLALPDDKRVVVVLHYWLDYSVRGIAEFLGIPPGTVASRLSRALGELRMTLGGVRVD